MTRLKARRKLAEGLAMVLNVFGNPERWIKEAPEAIESAKKVGDFWFLKVRYYDQLFDVKASSDSFQILKEARA